MNNGAEFMNNDTEFMNNGAIFMNSVVKFWNSVAKFMNNGALSVSSVPTSSRCDVSRLGSVVKFLPSNKSIIAF